MLDNKQTAFLDKENPVAWFRFFKLEETMSYSYRCFIFNSLFRQHHHKSHQARRIRYVFLIMPALHLRLFTIFTMLPTKC